jgi:hypothetical protein
MSSQITAIEQIAQIIKVVGSLRAYGQSQYDRRTITRGARKGKEMIMQSVEQRVLQGSIYTQMAHVEAVFLADQLELDLEERNEGRTFKLSKYPNYMGELNQEEIDLAFQYFTNTGIMESAKNEGVEVSRVDRARRLASVLQGNATWQVGSMRIQPEFLVA